MASPQKENGFTAIANELLEAFLRFPMADEPRRVFLAVLRKTYGFQKKEDRIPLSQISSLTGILPQHVCRAFSKLKKMGMLRRDSSGRTSIIKDYSVWVLPNQVLPNGATGTTQPGKAATTQPGRLKRKGQKKLSKETLYNGDKLSNEIPRKTILLPNEPKTMSEQIDHSFPRKRLYGDEVLNWTLDYAEHLLGHPLSGQERWNRIYAKHLKNKFGMRRVRECLEKTLVPGSWWFDHLSQLSTFYKNFEKLEADSLKEKKNLNTDITNL